MAAGSGVDSNRFRTYSALRYTKIDRIYKEKTWLEPTVECTSFMAVGKASGFDANVLTKNRDASMVPQSVRVKRLHGKIRVLGAGDAGHLGFCHAMNEAGLVCTSNAGSAIPTPIRNGICNTITMRYISENCMNCKEAIALLRDLHKNRFMSNGTGGSIWLMIDRNMGAIVETSPTQLAVHTVVDTVDARQNDFRLSEMGKPKTASKRYQTALSNMKKHNGHVQIRDLNRLSRNTDHYPESICHDATNSTTTSAAPFDQSAPPYWEIAIGHPKHTFFIPMSPMNLSMPETIVNGRLWDLSHTLFLDDKRGDRPVYDFESMEHHYRIDFANAKTEEAMTTVTATTTKTVETLLEEATKGVLKNKGVE